MSLAILLVLEAVTRYIVRHAKKPKAWYLYLARGLTALWVIGFTMQLLGTSFERWVLSLLLLLGVWAHVDLAKLVRKYQHKQGGWE